MSKVIKAYPLSWPLGWKQTPKQSRKRAVFKSDNRDITLFVAYKRVVETILKMKAKKNDIIISTNIPLNMNGLPYSISVSEGNIPNPGASVFWKDKSGDAKCIAIDIYDHVQDNVAALAATLEAMRAIERHGGAEILNRAFSNFVALPEKTDTTPNWRDVFNIKTENVSLEDIKLIYRSKAKTLHPDVGGDANGWLLFQRAYEMALQELAQ